MPFWGPWIPTSDVGLATLALPWSSAVPLTSARSQPAARPLTVPLTVIVAVAPVTVTDDTAIVPFAWPNTFGDVEEHANRMRAAVRRRVMASLLEVRRGRASIRAGIRPTKSTGGYSVCDGCRQKVNRDATCAC